MSSPPNDMSCIGAPLLYEMRMFPAAGRETMLFWQEGQYLTRKPLLIRDGKVDAPVASARDAGLEMMPSGPHTTFIAVWI